MNIILSRIEEIELILLRERDQTGAETAHRCLDTAAPAQLYLTHKARVLEQGLITADEATTIEHVLALWPLESYARRYAVRRVIEHFPRMTARDRMRMQGIAELLPSHKSV